MIVSNKNNPIFESRALPNDSVFYKLRLMQPLSAGSGRGFDEVAVFIERHPVPVFERENQHQRARCSGAHCFISSTVGINTEDDCDDDIVRRNPINTQRVHAVFHANSRALVPRR